MKIWVIGGTSGIGEEVASYLTTNHHSVLATGEEVNVAFLRKLMKYWDNHGPFDAIVYSAGVNRLSWIRDLLYSDALLVYDVNVVGFMRVLRIVANDTVCKSVVAISSDAAVRPMRTSIAYCASKAALDMAVKVAARELAPIRVNAVSPGMIEGTEMTSYIDREVPRIRGWSPEKAAEYERSQLPLGRRGTKAEVARVVSDVLFGPEYLTGAIIPVNGGR